MHVEILVDDESEGFLFGLDTNATQSIRAFARSHRFFVGNTAELSKFLKARKELEKAVKPEDIIDAE